MWENCHDYDAEVEAQMKPKPAPHVDLDRLDALFAEASLSELSSHHIVNDGWRHLANLCTAPDKPCFVLQHRKEVMDWFAAMHNGFPALAAELRTLRARVAELEQTNVSQETANALWYGKLEKALDHGLAIAAERDRLRAERDAARDEAAGLREALESINRLDENGNAVVKGWSEIDEIIRTAISRTPAQHRGRIVAAGLRELCDGVLFHEDANVKEKVMDEAKRLEKEAGNG